MSIVSVYFVAFLIAVSLLYYVVPKRLVNIYLVLVSYFFYYTQSREYTILLLALTVITWLMGLAIGTHRNAEQVVKKSAAQKWLLAIGVIGLTVFLGYFKYLNFAFSILQRLTKQAMFEHRFSIVMPAGVSFFTFLMIGYLVDVYKGKIEAEKNIIKYALFVSFFPKMVQGPIETGKHFLPQIAEKHRFSYDKVSRGVIRILYGYLMKAVIADNAATFVNTVYDSYGLYGTVELVVATLMFSLQIYCDFAGYTNIAIGAGELMGFDLLPNFKAPYLAGSVSEFWRRWHMSLTNWFRDYIYIPLGGNRKGKVRQYINILIVFMVSGLWHGASINFVVWGALNGIYQIIGSLMKPVRNKFCETFSVDRDSFSHRLLRRLVTFGLVSFSWIFFRAQGVRQALRIIRRMITVWNPWALTNGALAKIGLSGAKLNLIVIGAVVVLLVDRLIYREEDTFELLEKQGVWFRYLVLITLTVTVLVCGVYGSGYDATDFIYKNF